MEYRIAWFLLTTLRWVLNNNVVCEEEDASLHINICGLTMSVDRRRLFWCRCRDARALALHLKRRPYYEPHTLLKITWTVSNILNLWWVSMAFILRQRSCVLGCGRIKAYISGMLSQILTLQILIQMIYFTYCYNTTP